MIDLQIHMRWKFGRECVTYAFFSSKRVLGKTWSEVVCLLCKWCKLKKKKKLYSGLEEGDYTVITLVELMVSDFLIPLEDGGIFFLFPYYLSKIKNIWNFYAECRKKMLWNSEKKKMNGIILRKTSQRLIIISYFILKKEKIVGMSFHYLWDGIN